MSVMRASVPSVVFVGILAILALTPAFGQTLADGFDLSGEPILVQGVVTGMTFRREKTYMVVEVQDDANAPEVWVVVGEAMPTLIAAGWDLPQMPSQQQAGGAAGFGTRREIPYRGQRVTVSAYAPLSSVSLEDILGSDPPTLGGAPAGAPAAFAALAAGGPEVDLAEAFGSRRVVYGTTVSFQGGDDLVFGDAPPR